LSKRFLGGIEAIDGLVRVTSDVVASGGFAARSAAGWMMTGDFAGRRRSGTARMAFTVCWINERSGLVFHDFRFLGKLGGFWTIASSMDGSEWQQTGDPGCSSPGALTPRCDAPRSTPSSWFVLNGLPPGTAPISIMAFSLAAHRFTRGSAGHISPS